MYNIQNSVQNLQRLTHKNRRSVRDEKALKDIQELEIALEKFSGYKVNGFGTLVPTGKR